MTTVLPPTKTSKTGLKSGNVPGRIRRWRNADVLWDNFASRIYKKLHYSTVREDDRAIITQVRDFFASTQVRRRAKGIDAGSGPNLYPSLSMLPYCSRITLLDISASNVKFLRRQRFRPDRSWLDFWAILLGNGTYRAIGSLRLRLILRTRVKHGSLFDLKPDTYDIGTMFFVAESLSEDLGEFRQAVHCFVASLRPGSPFAIALMRGSKGYRVGNVDYPAVAIEDTDVKNCLSSVADNVNVINIDLVNQFRDGYEGMMLATGWSAQR